MIILLLLINPGGTITAKIFTLLNTQMMDTFEQIKNEYPALTQYHRRTY
jgi:hypothetical protein